jgi:hypothetical protein
MAFHRRMQPHEALAIARYFLRIAAKVATIINMIYFWRVAVKGALPQIMRLSPPAEGTQTSLRSLRSLDCAARELGSGLFAKALDCGARFARPE